MVFAQLIHYHMEAVLVFLSSIHLSEQQQSTTALEYVFKLWCDKQKVFFGAYDQKVRSVTFSPLEMTSSCSDKSY